MVWIRVSTDGQTENPSVAGTLCVVWLWWPAAAFALAVLRRNLTIAAALRISSLHLENKNHGNFISLLAVLPILEVVILSSLAAFSSCSWRQQGLEGRVHASP